MIVTGRGVECRQDHGPQKCQPFDDAAEVVAGGGEDGVGGVALGPGEVVSAHAMLGLGVSDNRPTAERRRNSRLMVSVTRRLGPEI
jgi:hypothetical protein